MTDLPSRIAWGALMLAIGYLLGQLVLVRCGFGVGDVGDAAVVSWISLLL